MKAKAKSTGVPAAELLRDALRRSLEDDDVPLPRSIGAGSSGTFAARDDELMLERPDGAVFRYEVAALDVVDSRRAELRLDADESIVVLVTCWPFEAVTVGGSWRYVVTARRRF